MTDYTDDIEDVDHVVTMGGSVDQLRSSGWDSQSGVRKLKSSSTRD